MVATQGKKATPSKPIGSALAAGGNGPAHIWNIKVRSGVDECSEGSGCPNLSSNVCKNNSAGFGEARIRARQGQRAEEIGRESESIVDGRERGVRRKWGGLGDRNKGRRLPCLQPFNPPVQAKVLFHRWSDRGVSCGRFGHIARRPARAATVRPSGRRRSNGEEVQRLIALRQGPSWQSARCVGPARGPAGGHGPRPGSSMMRPAARRPGAGERADEKARDCSPRRRAEKTKGDDAGPG